MGVKGHEQQGVAEKAGHGGDAQGTNVEIFSMDMEETIKSLTRDAGVDVSRLKTGLGRKGGTNRTVEKKGVNILEEDSTTMRKEAHKGASFK